MVNGAWSMENGEWRIQNGAQGLLLFIDMAADPSKLESVVLAAHLRWSLVYMLLLSITKPIHCPGPLYLQRSALDI